MNRPSEVAVTRTPCPDAAHLALYLDGVLNKTERRAVQAHLQTCFRCREIVADAARQMRVALPVASRGRTMWTAGLVAAAGLLIVVFVGWSLRDLLPNAWQGPQ